MSTAHWFFCLLAEYKCCSSVSGLSNFWPSSVFLRLQNLHPNRSSEWSDVCRTTLPNIMRTSVNSCQWESQKNHDLKLKDLDDRGTIWLKKKSSWGKRTCLIVSQPQYQRWRSPQSSPLTPTPTPCPAPNPTLAQMGDHMTSARRS